MVVAVRHAVVVAIAPPVRGVALTVPLALDEVIAAIALFPAARMPVHAVVLLHPVAAVPMMAAVGPLPEAGLPDVAGTRRRHHLVARRGRRHVDIKVDRGKSRHRATDRGGGHGSDEQLALFRHGVPPMGYLSPVTP